MTSYWAIASPLSSIAAIVVRPGATPRMNSEVGDAGRTSATRGSAANTLAAGALSITIRPVPASSAV